MPEMRKVNLSLLTREDMQRVHDDSLQLLKKNGVTFQSDRALEIFKKNGFRVDGQQVYFTAEQVEKALETVPHSFVFQARNPEKSLNLGGGDYGVATPIGPVNIRTMDEGVRRGTLKDVEDLVKIYQASDVIGINSNNGVEANDIPVENRHLETMRVTLRHTDKPLYTRLCSYEQMNESMDMVEIAVGEKLEIGGRLWFAPGSCPSMSPMQYSREVADCIVALAERGQIVTLGSATTAGVTGPIFPFGTTVLQNAEQLAGIVLTQLIHPGNAVGYGVAPTPANMHGATSSFSGPGRVALQIASIEMGKQFYHMPTRTEPYTTDSSVNDVQSGIDSYEGTMCNILAGADYQLGEIGTLDSLMTTSYEKTIIDEEISSRLLDIRKGIDVSEEAASVESICDVCGEDGDGNFMLEDDTIEHMHDGWYPTVSDWNRPDKITQDYEYVIRRANQEWKRRVAEAPASMLSPAQDEALDDYVKTHTR